VCTVGSRQPLNNYSVLLHHLRRLILQILLLLTLLPFLLLVLSASEVTSIDVYNTVINNSVIYVDVNT